MAHSCKLQGLLTHKLFLQLIPLVWIISGSFSVSVNTAPVQLHGEVGGNVTFHCPVDKKKTIKFFYLQRNDKFINGYYLLRPTTAQWENTRVDVNMSAVHLYGLNMSHRGEYTCIIQHDDLKIIHQNINLNVTAPYSKPTVTKSCTEEQPYHCLVTCASHGGYPHTKVTWDVPVPHNSSAQLWKIMNSSEVPDQSTMMYNSSSIAYFNCSNGELVMLSCSLGEVTSDMFSVCKNVEVIGSYNVPVAIAICVIASIAMGLAVFCARRRAAAARHVRDESRESKPEEVVVLNEKQGEQEAS